jgi:AraC family transcriptional activator of pobA
MKARSHDITLISLPQDGAATRQFMIGSLCDFDKIYFEHDPDAHRHDYYSIFWIRKGQLLHTVDDETFRVKGNSVFLVAPGQVHKMVFAGRAEGYFIAFSDSFLCLKDPEGHKGINGSLFFNGNLNSVIAVDKEQAALLEQTIRLMLLESGSMLDREAFFNLLSYFLIQLSRIREKNPQPYAAGPAGHPQSVFLEFRRQIEQHYASSKKVSDYARMLHMGAAQLNEISRQVSGITAGAHIRQRLLTEAKRYLHHTDFSSKQIAYKLGFDDPHYFSRFFKKSTGQSPQEFRFLVRRESSLIT